MNFFGSIIPTVVVLGLVIIIHEFGHFLACRLTRVKVEKFSIGFGPEILSWQGKETRYAVSWIPFGGYIKPAGESWSELGEEGPKPGDYLAAPLGARIFIICAGVLMNYLLGFVLLSGLYMAGRPVTGTTIESFLENYPAAVSGLKQGDRIIEVDGKPVSNWAGLTKAFQEGSPEGLKILAERPSTEGRFEILPFTVVPKIQEFVDPFGHKIDLKLIGIKPDLKATQFLRYGFPESLWHGAADTVDLTVRTHQAIFYLVIGRMSIKNISGPVGIISMAGRAAKYGIPYLVELTALLSISLAVINLLPIPALDGGHLLFLLIEAVRRKRVSLEVQEKFTQVGFTLLIVLMVFVIYNDLVNLDVFDKVKGLFHIK